jgi:hypothetical protein
MNINTELICITKNNKKILFNNIESHAATHFSDTPELRELISNILKQKELTESEISIDVDMGKPIGTSDVVDIDETDYIVYAYRKNRREQGHVPFTKSRKAQLNSHVSMHLNKIDEGIYELASAWIGEFDSPPFPEDPNATTESNSYWSKHAFVWGSQEIIPESELKVCPW